MTLTHYRDPYGNIIDSYGRIVIPAQYSQEDILKLKIDIERWKESKKQK